MASIFSFINTKSISELNFNYCGANPLPLADCCPSANSSPVRAFVTIFEIESFFAEQAVEIKLCSCSTVKNFTSCFVEPGNLS